MNSMNDSMNDGVKSMTDGAISRFDMSYIPPTDNTALRAPRWFILKL